MEIERNGGGGACGSEDKENMCQQQPAYLTNPSNQSSYPNNEMIVSQNENLQVYHNHLPPQQQLLHQQHHTNGNVNAITAPSSNALEAYGIVSLKESKIDAWMMTNKSTQPVTTSTTAVSAVVGTATNGGVMKGSGVAERHKLTLPLDSNNKSHVKCRYQEQPRMAWAEQQLSDE